MTPHEPVEDLREDSRSSVGTVRCPRCGSSAVVRYRSGPEMGLDELRRLAWRHFLLNVLWDCDQALVAETMSR